MAGVAQQGEKLATQKEFQGPRHNLPKGCNVHVWRVICAYWRVVPDKALKERDTILLISKLLIWTSHRAPHHREPVSVSV